MVRFIGLYREQESVRWKVYLWANSPDTEPIIVVTLPNEREARKWAEKVATSWEMEGYEWYVAEDSL